MSLMISISGIRGIVGDSLTPATVVKYASAFAEYCNKGPIVIGRDGRITGKMIGNLVSSTLIAAGADVRALGVSSTPGVALAINHFKAAGGISITASHNPMQWNGLKFIGPDGVFLNADENKKLWAIADRGSIPFAAWDRIGKHSVDEAFFEQHIARVLTLPVLNVDRIRRRRIKVVVDAVNAAGGIIVPALLRELGCRVVEMNCDVSGVFSHTPEPLPENLGDLCRRVKEEKADLGIAVDPDVDRLVLINEKGEPFGEEYTITSAVRLILRSGNAGKPVPPGSTVAVNLSTTRAVDDVAKSYGAVVHRSPVGEINVVQKMKQVNAVIGGEGSGGVIYPGLQHARDAMGGIGLILQELSDFDGTASEYRASLPQYVITKAKIGVGPTDPDRLLAGIAKRYADAGRINTDDGLKLDFPTSWVHLRKSNTEPIIRVIAEAPTAREAEELVAKFRKEMPA